MNANVVALDGLKIGSRDTLAEAMGKKGCEAKSCGAKGDAADLPPDVWEKVKDHPCYSEDAHHYFARMHVAVAPACNIQCNYCNRKYDCANESRPGVVSERLSPEDAARKVIAVANEVPQLAVLGIAGPGDGAYDWAKTRATFDLVRAQLPDIKLCLSTNGLALAERVDELVDMNVAHVTLTINMIDPHVGEAIYPWVFWRHKRHTGLDAARILHEQQIESLERLAERNILVKVNSVLIPGINDDHLVEVNAAVKDRGAFLHNIMPLISAPEHGTVFGLEGRRGPSAVELERVRDACQGGAAMMRHCRQCRADAVGLLGEDRGQEFTMDLVPDEVSYDSTRREAYRTWVEHERADRHAAAAGAREHVGATVEPDEAPLLVAVCTKGGGRINQHFGHAKEFQLFEVDAAGVRLRGHRRADNYCVDGHGEDDRLDAAIRALEGVTVILCARIGDRPREALAAAGIETIADYAHDYIETGIAAVYAHLRGGERPSIAIA